MLEAESLFVQPRESFLGQPMGQTSFAQTESFLLEALSFEWWKMKKAVASDASEPTFLQMEASLFLEVQWTTSAPLFDQLSETCPKELSFALMLMMVHHHHHALLPTFVFQMEACLFSELQWTTSAPDLFDKMLSETSAFSFALIIMISVLHQYHV